MTAHTRSRDAALVGTGLVVAAVMIAQLLDFGYGRDQGIFAAVGRAIRDGGVPYRDAWDFKPPGIYFLYALAGTPTSGIRWLEACGLISLVAACARISRFYLGDLRPGLVGGALAIVTYVRLEFWHTAQPESFGAIAVAWGMVCAVEAMDDTRSRTVSRVFWILGGACYGAAALLKPMLGAAGVASLAAGVRHARRRAGAPLSRAALGGALIAGALLPIGGCAAFFALRGGGAELAAATLGFAPQYASLAWQQTTVAASLVKMLRGWLLAPSALNVAGLALLVALPLPAGRPREGVVHVWVAIAVLLAGVAAQARFVPYHFGAVLPLTAWLAGWGYWQLWRQVREGWVGIAGFAVLVLLLSVWPRPATDLAEGFAERCRLRATAWLYRSERQAIRDHLYAVADYRARDNRLLSEWLTRETNPGAVVFIYGFTPEVYVTSSRRLASRYIFDVPQRAAWSRDAARDELMSELAASRPDIVVVQHGDLIPWVTGQPSDSATDLLTFTGLRQLLERAYVPAARIGTFDVYRRTR
jgi:hypothetical protein